MVDCVLICDTLYPPPTRDFTELKDFSVDFFLDKVKSASTWLWLLNLPMFQLDAVIFLGNNMYGYKSCTYMYVYHFMCFT